MISSQTVFGHFTHLLIFLAVRGTQYAKYSFNKRHVQDRTTTSSDASFFSCLIFSSFSLFTRLLLHTQLGNPAEKPAMVDMEVMYEIMGSISF